MNCRRCGFRLGGPAGISIGSSFTREPSTMPLAGTSCLMCGTWHEAAFVPVMKLTKSMITVGNTHNTKNNEQKQKDIANMLDHMKTARRLYKQGITLFAIIKRLELRVSPKTLSNYMKKTEGVL